MKKRIFITGGDGFIGSNLIHELATQGFETASFDAHLSFIRNDSYYDRCMKIRKKLFMQPSKRYHGDIRNEQLLQKAMSAFRPDIVVHLAGLPMARVHESFADDMLSINMVGTLNTLKVFEASKAERIVYTSSSMAYGHFTQTPQPEDVLLHPVNAYGACKAAGEYFVTLSHKDWVIVRPTSVYGFVDCANRVSQLLLDAAYAKKPAWVVKGETLDFSYVEDVAHGLFLATFQKDACCETINISAGKARAASEFAQIVASYFPDFRFEVRAPSTQQVYRGPQDIRRAKKILHYQPKYSLEEGIKKIIALNEEYHFYPIGSTS